MSLADKYPFYLANEPHSPNTVVRFVTGTGVPITIRGGSSPT